MGRLGVLVTGASSALMQRVIGRIDRERYRVTGLSRDAARLKGLGIEVREGDICDAAFVDSTVEGMSLVVHAAAATYEREAAEYFRVNLEGARNVARACGRRGTPRLAFVSSRAACEHAGAYGLSKLRAEEIIEAECAHWSILRPAEVFGGAKSEGIDKLIDGARHRRLVPCPAGPAGLLFPIHIDDAAAAIHHFVFDAWQDCSTHTINGKDGFTLPQLVRCVAQCSQRWALPLPVPKTAMYLLGWMSETTGADFGFVPDQVPRLYSPKAKGAPWPASLSLAQYLTDLGSRPA